MPRLAIIAHRGASAIAPEGTRAAIQAAGRAGADAVELDVQLTRDARLVIFHDTRVDRTTGGRGRIGRMRYAQVARLDAGMRFGARFVGERVLLASQALRLTPSRMWVNLELKRTTRQRVLLQRVRSVIRSARVRRRLLLSSFDARLLAALRTCGVPLALICRRDPDRSLRRAIGLGCSAWHPFHTLVTKARMIRAHAAGLRVHAWTVDDRSRARILLRCGVDGIFTNDPGRLRGLMP